MYSALGAGGKPPVAALGFFFTAFFIGFACDFVPAVFCGKPAFFGGFFCGGAPFVFCGKPAFFIGVFCSAFFIAFGAMVNTVALATKGGVSSQNGYTCGITTHHGLSTKVNHNCQTLSAMLSQ